MQPTRYANRIVVRRDTATGMVLVGYATEMPLERFEHVADVCATEDSAPLRAGNPHYAQYEKACRRARGANANLIEMRAGEARSRGWIPVPLALSGVGLRMGSDLFGSYRGAAMNVLFRLCSNETEVWAVVDENVVTHVQRCRPPRPMEALEQAVWERYWLRKLSSYSGRVWEGRLIADDSGLWMCPLRMRHD